MNADKFKVFPITSRRRFHLRCTQAPSAVLGIRAKGLRRTSKRKFSILSSLVGGGERGISPNQLRIGAPPPTR